MGGNNKGILESWAYKANYSRMKKKEGMKKGRNRERNWEKNSALSVLPILGYQVIALKKRGFHGKNIPKHHSSGPAVEHSFSCFYVSFLRC